jgi:hypothetical protein
MTTEEKNTLGIFERKIHEPVKEGEGWRIRTREYRI